MPSKRRIKFSCSTWKEIPVLTELKFHRVDVSALKLLLTAAQNVTEYSELEFFQLHLWAGSLGEPGVAPDPKIHKTWDLPNSHFSSPDPLPPRCTTPCWTSSHRGHAWAGEGFQRKPNSPLVAVQKVFSWLLPGGATAAAQQMATALHKALHLQDLRLPVLQSSARASL